MKTIPSEMVRARHSPFEVVWKAIGGEETVQSWVNETNYRAERYFDSTRNIDEEEEARENVATQFFWCAKKDLRGPETTVRTSKRQTSADEESGDEADIEEVPVAVL